MIELRNWQAEAYNIFVKNKYKGIIKAATGTGKTILAINFIEQFKADIVFSSEESFLIVVPTERLLSQWSDRIEVLTGLDVGKIGGGFNFERKVTVAIINSIREKKLKYNNLILDECHNYLSEVNGLLLENNKYDRIMALSATPERKDLKDYSKYGLNIIYEYSTVDAIANKDLCEYVVLEEGLSLNQTERDIYNKCDATIKELFPMFHYNLNYLYSAKFSVAKSRLTRAIATRIKVLARVENKFKKVVELIKKNPDNKVIVFAQYIYAINQLKSMLKKEGILSEVYHSGKDGGKKDSIEKFKTNQVRVLLSARALDEGLDVPDCDMAIIMAGFKGERQIRQRLGRILRKKEKTAIIYLLYALDSNDEKWLKEMLKYIG